VAHNISSQIEDKLELALDKTNSTLLAKSNHLPKQSSIERRKFSAEANEYSWVANKISSLIKNGIDASEIAVIAPKHKILENTVPFLKKLNIPMSYEKRENILETEIIQSLHSIAVLVNALSANDVGLINQYFPVVLGLPFWRIKAEEIWKTNWQFASKNNNKVWPEIALSNKNLNDATVFILELSNSANIEPLEITLDKVIGTKPVTINQKEVYSPLKDYYFTKSKQTDSPLKYYESITHLSVIRSNLRDYQASNDKQLTISDFINFFAMYESAEEALINSHPVAQGQNSIQLLTAYKAKGLEFEYVFILQAHDDVWGAKSRGSTNKLPLPLNLSHIRYLSSSNDERLRLLYVAITRAKHGLFISSHSTKDNGKPTSSLKYLSENDEISPHLPKKSQLIVQEMSKPRQLAENTETLWQAGYVELPANLKDLLTDRLKSYRLSPTHLNSFTDMEFSGPHAFLMQTILRFPQAPNASGEYGTAIHNTLEWLQNQINTHGRPGNNQILEQYEKELGHRYMAINDKQQATKKGRNALEAYLNKNDKIFTKPAKAEVNFYEEGVVINDAHLSGKIDRLEINQQDKTVEIVDYKTGSPIKKWGSSTKAHKYKQQLYLYKILIENSITYKNYRVKSARLEFIEPINLSTNTLAAPLYLNFNEPEEQEIKQLLGIVWQHIISLDLPDISSYSQDLKGTLDFEKDLLTKKI
ncbi:PD-(D/E)XK nuclease family protein, partial [Candidatus Saccharibacteria bacterium]|nr:PD-(D/E)XK nuclease family protein [Candidatus Saccharibacteria bacterium]